MATVVVENFYPDPIDLDALVGQIRDLGWCHDLHGAVGLFHSVTIDGSRSLCVFEAPDVEAMRSVSRRARPSVPPGIWGATTHFHPAETDRTASLRPGETTYGIVDRSFPTSMAYETLQSMEDERVSCLTFHRVRFLCSFLALDGRRMACVYAAPDLESIRMAIRGTELPFDDILAATTH